LYYRWSKEFLEAGKKRLAGDTAREATSDEVKTLRSEARQLKEALAEFAIENRVLKKSVIADGENIECGILPPKNSRSSGSSRPHRCRYGARWPRSASRSRPSMPGMTATCLAVSRRWRIAGRDHVASGTASPMRFATKFSSWRSISPS